MKPTRRVPSGYSVRNHSIDVTAKSLDQLKVASSTTCVPRKSSFDAIVDPQSVRRLLHSERWCRHEGVAAE